VLEEIQPSCSKKKTPYAVGLGWEVDEEAGRGEEKTRRAMGEEEILVHIYTTRGTSARWRQDDTAWAHRLTRRLVLG